MPIEGVVIETEPTPPQQDVPIVRVCWDELFNFIKLWFSKAKRYAEKAIFEIGRYAGVSTTYQELAKWTVDPTCARGILKEISLASDSYTNTTFKVVIAGLTKEIQVVSAYTLPYQDLELQPTMVIAVYAKSDGAAIVANGAIAGKELYPYA